VDYNTMGRQKQIIGEGDIKSETEPGGYQYFGAPNDLPGGAELLEKC
jgi:hypothetical protein